MATALPAPAFPMRHAIQRWARAIKRDVVAVWLAARDPRVPWYAKAVALAVAAYALSPIDWKLWIRARPCVA